MDQHTHTHTRALLHAKNVTDHVAFVLADGHRRHEKLTDDNRQAKNMRCKKMATIYDGIEIFSASWCHIMRAVDATGQ